MTRDEWWELAGGLRHAASVIEPPTDPKITEHPERWPDWSPDERRRIAMNCRDVADEIERQHPFRTLGDCV